MAYPRRVAQLAQRLGFDLADAFTCNLEFAAHFFQGAAAAIVEAKGKLLRVEMPAGSVVRVMGKLE